MGWIVVLKTAFGGLLAISAQVLVLGLNISMDSWMYLFVIAFTVLLTLSLARALNFHEYAMSMAAILVVLILCSYNNTLSISILYSINRIVETIIGIVIAGVVNLSIKPNKRSD